MPAKTSQIQVRVSPAEKEALKRRARQAGLDLSAYVLSRALPAAAARFQALLDELRRDDEPAYGLAALNDLLAALAPGELLAAVADADLRGLSPFLCNYVAAMVEHAASRGGVRPPPWVREVEPLEEPFFATPFASLRPHLLRVSPVAFKRRNLFVDATVGDRV
jgi:hypothetical protein